MATATAIKPTKKQCEAAELVRAYLRSARVPIEEEEVGDDGVIRLHTSDRESAGDDAPSEKLMQAMREHAIALRKLSKLTYVTVEALDEWACLTVKVRPTPRKDKPEVEDGLAEKVRDSLPEEISKHLLLKRLGSLHQMGRYPGVSVILTSRNRYQDFNSIPLTWDLTGSAVEGWRLEVRWGVHRISRPATFKKLQARRIVMQLGKILDNMKDPMDAMGWAIYGQKDGSYIRRFGRSAEKELFELWQIRNDKTNGIHSSQSATSYEFENKLSGDRKYAAIGDYVPEAVLPLDIVE